MVKKFMNTETRKILRQALRELTDCGAIEREPPIALNSREFYEWVLVDLQKGLETVAS